MHDVAKHVSTKAAAKALPQPRGGVDVKRRGLLVVEGTATPPVGTPAPEFDRLAYQLKEVRSLANTPPSSLVPICSSMEVSSLLSVQASLSYRVKPQQILKT